MSEVRVKVDRVILDGSIVKTSDVQVISGDIQSALQTILRDERVAGLKSSDVSSVLVQDANSGTSMSGRQVGGTLARTIFRAIKGPSE